MSRVGPGQTSPFVFSITRLVCEQSSGDGREQLPAAHLLPLSYTLSGSALASQVDRFPAATGPFVIKIRDRIIYFS